MDKTNDVGQARILAELTAVPEALSLCWMGNAGWLVACGGRMWAIDPDLEGADRLSPPPISSHVLAAGLEAVFITHEHDDHFNFQTAQVLARESRCLFVVPANCVQKARSAGLSEGRIRIAPPRKAFDLEGLRILPLRAIHGHRDGTIYSDANLDDCGYLLEMGPFRLLQPGDSLLAQEHLLQGRLDALMVSPTEHNMWIEPAARLIHALRPAHVFPQHFDTYVQTPDNSFWTIGHAARLRQSLDAEMAGRFHQMGQGQVFRIAPPYFSPMQ